MITNFYLIDHEAVSLCNAQPQLYGLDKKTARLCVVSEGEAFGSLLKGIVCFY